MDIPDNYYERVYAGVLGKIIGVYLGRPFEGWSQAKIASELGEIWRYVNDKFNVPLVVADDDISGTFTFLRATEDFGFSRDLSSEQIGKSWLNYLVENRTILWWGGMGHSTEHTAYLRLKHGIPAPKSGSQQLNGKIVSEQIGAQIFIDGWAMVAPGEPEFAVDLARRAASVSHDGEAIYAAQMLAAMESMAFVEADRDKLLDIGLSLIPKDSVIARMIGDVREWHKLDQDWRATFRRIEESYGYDRYIGNCHVVPNHALIILGLLYGDNDFQKSLMIVNSCGWDTDCNSGNLGCLLGIKNGLDGIKPSAVNSEQAFNLRAPIADRLFVASADGGRVISDAVIEAGHIVNSYRGLHSFPPIHPKDGARFHFELPGSTQGFSCQAAKVSNVPGHSESGLRSLQIDASHLKPDSPIRIATPTFIPPENLTTTGYHLSASPTVYPGQVIRARLETSSENPFPQKAGLGIAHYDANDQLIYMSGPRLSLSPGESGIIQWQVPADVHPVAEVAIELDSPGDIYLDWMRWDGAPEVKFTQPIASKLSLPGPKVWRKAWIDAVDHWTSGPEAAFRIIQDEGTGWLLQGGRDWKDYHVSTRVTPTLVRECGLLARVQGLRRYYALMLAENGCIQLNKLVDDEKTTLAQQAVGWRAYEQYGLSLEVDGNLIRAWLDNSLLFEIQDDSNPLLDGGIGLTVSDGHMYANEVRVSPITRNSAIH